MRNFNQIPKNELMPLEKYKRAYYLILKKIIDENPDLEYLQYDENVLLAKGSEFPIIDENGNVGKSIFSGVLKQDDLKEKNQELTNKIRKMFEDFGNIYPDVQVEKFPKEQDYDCINKKQNIGKKNDENLVKMQIIYANTKLMEQKRMLKKEEAEEIIRNNLIKLLDKKTIQ